MPIASVPLLLHAWGRDVYSGWLVISAVPAWLSMADLGFGTVAANEISIRLASNDVDGAKQSLHSTWLVILALTFGGMLIVLPLVGLLPWEKWLSVDLGSAQSMRLALMLLCCATLLSLPGGLFMGLYRASGKAALGMYIIGIKPALDFGFLYISILLRSGPQGASMAVLGSQLVFIVIFGIFAVRSCPILRLGFSHFSYSDFEYSLRKGTAFMLFPLGNSFLQQGSVLVVNATLGPAAVVLYGTARTLTRSANQLMTLVNNSIWPELSLLIGAKNWKKVQQLHRISVKISIVFAICMILILISIGPWIYGIWTAQEIEISRALLLAFSAAILTNALWFTSSVILAASNQHESLAWRYFIGSLCSVPICYFLAAYYGLIGAAISSIFVDILLIPYVIKTSLQVTNDSWRDFIHN